MGRKAKANTDTLQKVLTPPLLKPRQFCGAFEASEKPALEIEELVQI
jgi:hypothetical protein